MSEVKRPERFFPPASGPRYKPSDSKHMHWMPRRPPAAPSQYAMRAYKRIDARGGACTRPSGAGGRSRAPGGGRDARRGRVKPKRWDEWDQWDLWDPWNLWDMGGPCGGWGWSHSSHVSHRSHSLRPSLRCCQAALGGLLEVLLGRLGAGLGEVGVDGGGLGLLARGDKGVGEGHRGV